jgi:Protein of unknown function (DUF3303)
MLFLVSWSGRPEFREAAVDRFLKTGGQPPEGARMISRWHAVGPLSGFAIVESNDVAPLQSWVLDWSDLLAMDVRPAISDEQLSSSLAALRRQ